MDFARTLVFFAHSLTGHQELSALRRKESPQLYEFGADVRAKKTKRQFSLLRKRTQISHSCLDSQDSLIIIPVNLCSNEALIAVTVLEQFIIAIGTCYNQDLKSIRILNTDI